MYTCTKLDTEPQRNRPAVLSSHLGRGLTGPDLSSRSSATSESNHHEVSSSRGSRRSSPLPSSSHDRRRGAGALPQRPFHSEELPRRASLPDVLAGPLKVFHHPERIQERDPKFATPSTAMTVFHEACVPAYFVSIPLPPQLAGVLPLTAPGGHSGRGLGRHRLPRYFHEACIPTASVRNTANDLGHDLSRAITLAEASLLELYNVVTSRCWILHIEGLRFHLETT